MPYRTFPEVKRDDKFTSLWFPPGEKEITSSPKLIKYYNLVENTHYFVVPPPQTKTSQTRTQRKYIIYPEGEKFLQHGKIKREIEQLSERKISESTNCVERKSTDNTTYDECSKQNEADLEQLKNIKTEQNNYTADYSQKQDHFHNELVEIVTNVSEFVEKMKSLDFKGVINKLENKNTLY